MEKGCWYRGCDAVGEARPMFARSHGLPITLRLCEPHLSEVSREPARAAAHIGGPTRNRVERHR